MNSPSFDAIVIGSGISGGWAAKELCERGLKTLVLERGPDLQHVQDYTYDFANPWDLDGRGMISEDIRSRDYPVQQRCGVFTEYNRERFVNDRLHPYIEKHPFDWIRGYQTGGRSVLWGRQTYRFSDLDFNANKTDGHGTDWPIRYRDLAEWYDYVEAFAGIAGNTDGIDHLPDGVFLPPIELNAAEKAVLPQFKKAFPDRHLISARVANLTQPKSHHTELGRNPCQFRNQCHRGCSFGAYFSSQSATLPAARNTGNLTQVNNAIVKEIVYDAEMGRASGVRVIDRLTHQETVYQARIVFLCASTLGTVQVLLNSVSDHFPNGLGNSSGTVGRYLMDHMMVGGASGYVPNLDDRYYTGRRPGGIYIPRFVNLQKQTEPYLRGFGFQGSASRGTWNRRLNTEGIGKALKAELHNPAPWKMTIIGFGEMLPHADNRATLSREKRDEWGIPLLEVDVQLRDNERAMQPHIIDSAVDMLKQSGLQNVTPISLNYRPGGSIHEMGGARMGSDASTSVLNRHNQSHDVRNLFITDGSSMASTGCQNPSLTYMAMTARAVDYAVKELKQGRL